MAGLVHQWKYDSDYPSMLIYNLPIPDMVLKIKNLIKLNDKNQKTLTKIIMNILVGKN